MRLSMPRLLAAASAALVPTYETRRWSWMVIAQLAGTRIWTILLESWNIEVDLGRGVSAHRVKLIFDPEGPAPAAF